MYTRRRRPRYKSLRYKKRRQRKRTRRWGKIRRRKQSGQRRTQRGGMYSWLEKRVPPRSVAGTWLKDRKIAEDARRALYERRAAAGPGTAYVKTYHRDNPRVQSDLERARSMARYDAETARQKNIQEEEAMKRLQKAEREVGRQRREELAAVRAGRPPAGQRLPWDQERYLAR